MRIVNVSTGSVTSCDGCGGDHPRVAIYNCVSGPGIDVPEGATKAIVCPDLDYTIVLIDAGHIDAESLPEASS